MYKTYDLKFSKFLGFKNRNLSKTSHMISSNISACNCPANCRL